MLNIFTDLVGLFTNFVTPIVISAYRLSVYIGYKNISSTPDDVLITNFSVILYNYI